MGLTAAFIFAATSTAVSVYGQVKEGQAAESAGEREQKAAESAARLLEGRAETSVKKSKEAILLGTQDENQFRGQLRQLFGSQRAAIAGNNVDTTFGSAGDVTQEAQRLGELDLLRIKTNATRTSEAYLTEAADYRTQADNARKTGQYALEAGSQAKTSAYVGAGATIIGGAGDFLSMKYGMGRKARTPRY